MNCLNSNILLAILLGILVVAIICFLNSNNRPIPNHGTLSQINGISPLPSKSINSYEASDHIVDDLISQCDQKNYAPSDPMASDYGPFNDYERKKRTDSRKLDEPYQDDHDPREFVYKKKKYTWRTPKDVEDQFDLDKMLPQEYEKDWFEVVNKPDPKRVKEPRLIDPNFFIGDNTIAGSLRNAIHDPRGDIVIPKHEISPWNNSTIEADTNLKGFCNPSW